MANRGKTRSPRRRGLALALLAGLVFATWPAVPAPAQDPAPSMRIQTGITRAISPHIHVIPANGRRAVPNVGIVVGSRAVLVIDSGLGRISGETILAEVRKIAGDRRIYVIATHAHPEHIGGEQAFPPSATILRPSGQQREVDTSAGRMIEGFRSISADSRLLLEGFAFRPADLVLDGPVSLDLGGVVVDIMSAAPAHTDGDVALLVKQDNVLFTGDVVQQNYAPVLVGTGSSLASWLAQIDKLEQLPAQIIVPSHTAITDRRAFADMRGMLVFVRDRWAEIKTRKLAPAEAEALLIADFKARYPDCGNADFLRNSIARF